MGGMMIENYQRWLWKMASVIAPRHPRLWHDLAQEGAIAMWRAQESYDPEKGALASWVTEAAKMRMRDAYRRRTWTGSENPRGHRRTGEHETPVDQLTDLDWMEWRMPPAMQPNHDIYYHRDDIIKAIRELPEDRREYVFARFWEDKTQPGTRWKWQRIRPILKEKLAHLEDAY